MEKPIKGHLACLEAWPGACRPGLKGPGDGISSPLPGPRLGTHRPEAGDRWPGHNAHLPGRLLPFRGPVLPPSSLADLLSALSPCPPRLPPSPSQASRKEGPAGLTRMSGAFPPASAGAGSARVQVWAWACTCVCGLCCGGPLWAQSTWRCRGACGDTEEGGSLEEGAQVSQGPGSCRCRTPVCAVTCSAWALESQTGHLLSCFLSTSICCVTRGPSRPLCGPQFPLLSKRGVSLDAPKAFSVLTSIPSIQGRGKNEIKCAAVLVTWTPQGPELCGCALPPGPGPAQLVPFLAVAPPPSDPSGPQLCPAVLLQMGAVIRRSLVEGHLTAAGARGAAGMRPECRPVLELL